VQATGSIGSVSTESTANVYPTGVEATSSLGDVTFVLSIVEIVGSVTGTALLGTPVASADADVPVTGLQAQGYLGVVNIWGEIDDNQSPNWQDITSIQDPLWGTVNDAQNPDWQGIADAQDPLWGTVNDTQDPDWQNIAA
jgi:hypothetical protein